MAACLQLGWSSRLSRMRFAAMLYACGRELVAAIYSQAAISQPRFVTCSKLSVTTTAIRSQTASSWLPFTAWRWQFVARPDVVATNHSQIMAADSWPSSGSDLGPWVPCGDSWSSPAVDLRVWDEEWKPCSAGIWMDEKIGKNWSMI